MKRTHLVLLIILGVLVIDQAIKFWVKTQMHYGEEFRLLGLDWARIHFVENEGMAFGISLGGERGKLILSIFRIVAVSFLGYILYGLIIAREVRGLLVCFALIFAGAMGNIIDSAFYGILFSNSNYHGGLAEFMPESGGYASFLHGRVVDMLYFPIIDTRWPEWLPLWGGERFQFFKPVFNIADSAISTGVISLLVFYRNFFSIRKPTDETEDGEGISKNETAVPMGTGVSEEE